MAMARMVATRKAAEYYRRGTAIFPRRWKRCLTVHCARSGSTRDRTAGHLERRARVKQAAARCAPSDAGDPGCSSESAEHQHRHVVVMTTMLCGREDSPEQLVGGDGG